MARFKSLPFVVIFAFLLLACAGKKKVAEIPHQPIPKIPQYALDNRFMSSLIAGHFALISNDYLTAQKQFQNCLLIKPQQPEALYRLAQTEFKLGNLDKALDYIKNAIKNDRENNLWYRLQFVELLTAKGELLNAATQLQKLLDVNPAYQFIYPLADSAWRNVSEWNRAEQVWKQYQHVFPQDAPHADRHLIDLYLKQNKRNEALALSKSLFQTDSTDGVYVLLYAKTLYAAGNNAVLINLFESYTRPNAVVIHKDEFYSGAYYLSIDAAMSKYAVVYASLALSTGQNNQLLAHFVNEVNRHTFDGVLTASTLKISAQSNPLNAELQLLAGVQFLKENNFDEAVQFLKRSKQLGNTSFMMYNTLCQALQKSGNLKELKIISEEALELYPFSKELQEYQGEK
ncbi:MAG: tetratricopeptide repeat protein [Bacteroidia bacterium]|nr:tetratricopeptide repeat protein [Bacteroidia bacterium]